MKKLPKNASASDEGENKVPTPSGRAEDHVDEQEQVLDWELRREIRRFTEAQRAVRTRWEYEKAVRDFLKVSGISRLRQLLGVTADDVVGYRNRLQRRGLSPATINMRLAAVRGLFSMLLVRGRVDGNPADPKLVKSLRNSDVSRTEGLSRHEIQEMLSTCDGTLRGLRDRALILTLFYEGLRRSEVTKLRWRDITTRRGLLEVRDAKNSPYETIRLRPEVRRAVTDYHEVFSREIRRPRPRPNDPVFTSLSIRSFGRSLAPSSVGEIVKSRARAAGISRRITAHSLRHATATAALAAGVPLHQVRRHMRHRDVRTTLRYDRERDTRKNPTTDRLPEF